MVSSGCGQHLLWLEAGLTLSTTFVRNAEAIAEIDITAADALRDFAVELRKRDISFAMARLKRDSYLLLERVGIAACPGRLQRPQSRPLSSAWL